MAGLITEENIKQLEREGFMVVRGVLSEEEVEKALSGIWDFIEGLESGVSRDDPTTWTRQRWPDNIHGIIQNLGLLLVPLHSLFRSKRRRGSRSKKTIKKKKKK